MTSVTVVSARTIEILSHFSTINPSLLVRPGNVLTTVSPTKDIFATATVAETFPVEFAIFDLERFLKVLKLTDNTIAEFGGGALTLGSNGEAQYSCADQNFIISPPAGTTLPLAKRTSAKFKVSADVLANLKKAQKVLFRYGSASIECDGTSTTLLLGSHEQDPFRDTWKVSLGSGRTEFKATFNAGHLTKLIKGDYHVTLGVAKEHKDVKLARFETSDVTYFVCCE